MNQDYKHRKSYGSVCVFTTVGVHTSTQEETDIQSAYMSRHASDGTLLLTELSSAMFISATSHIP